MTDRAKPIRGDFKQIAATLKILLKRSPGAHAPGFFRTLNARAAVA